MMKKKLLLIPLLIGIFCIDSISIIFAQANLDLEAWSPVGTPPAEDPDGWGSLNEFTLFGFPPSTFKDTTDPGEGLVSAKLESFYHPGGTGLPPDTLGGMLFLGGYNLQTGQNGIAHTQKPISVDFIYKANPLVNDTGVVLIQLSHWDTNLNSTIIDGQGIMVFPVKVPNWTPASISISYFTSNTPDTLQIIATSSGNNMLVIGMLGVAIGVQRLGSQLFLDSFVIVLPPVGIDATAAVPQFKLYPNPVHSDILNVVTAFRGEASIDVFDMTGKQIKRVAIKGEITKVNMTKFPDGMYIYQIVNRKGSVLTKGKFSIVK